MRRVDVLIDALSELTGRDEKAVAHTFEAIISNNPEKGKDLLEDISFHEASAMRERLLKDGPTVLARLVSRLGE